MSSHKNLSIFDLFGLFTVMITVIYRPLSIWLFHFDGAARVPTLCCIVSFIVLFPKIKHYLFSKPFVFYLLLAVFQYVNGLIKGSYLNYDKAGIYLLTAHIFLPYISLLLVYNAARKKFDYTLRVCTLGLFTYSFICFVIGEILSNIERTEYAINANEIALYCAISVGLFLLSYSRRIISWYYLFFASIPLVCVVITASRMGITMIAIMMFGYWSMTTNKKHRSLKSLFLSLTILLVLVVGFLLLMNYSEVGERMASTTEQTEIGTTGTILDYFGDRGLQYFLSWPYFLRNPITGIGVGNWIGYNPFGLVCHSEYMVQYLEGGLISFVLYCLFWAYMLKQLNLARKKSYNARIRSPRILLIFILLSILFANSVLWSYDMYCVFIVYALVLGFCQSGQK